MLKVRSRALVCFVGLTTIASRGRAQTRPVLTPVAMDRAIGAEVDSGFSGVVLVAQNGRVVLRRAYSAAAHRPRETSPFWIASITKSFTAAAILSLQQDGRLSVHDSLYRFFPDAPRDKRAITIHQLLTHTAGLASSTTASGITTRESAVSAILEQPLTYSPGRGYAYGNGDYELLAGVIEAVTGLPWQNVVQRRILDPLHLSHTGFWCGPLNRVPRPVPGMKQRGTQCSASQSDWGHRGANGMSSTADDLLTWTTALGNPRRSTNRFSSLTSPQVLVRKEGPLDVYYGYGVRIVWL